jgi:glyoxylase-like metal-dependent hydrolase (beta-lactamase superfamily II)
LNPRPGIAGRIGLLLPGEWAPPVPIHAWLIEHGGQWILVDAGETAGAKSLPFVRYEVDASLELPAALGALGLTAADIDVAIVTHTHSDHIDGAVHLRGPVLISRDEWAFAHSAFGRLSQRLSRAPLPAGVEFAPFLMDAGPFGAFAASRRITEDGRVVAVATPGHTPGHISVIAVDDEGRHLLLAGDVSDSLEQLIARRPDAIAPRPKVLLETMDRVREHARRHPTVYLPSHDSESVARLEARTLLGPADGGPSAR